MQENNNEVILTIIVAVALLMFIGAIMLFIAVYYTNTKKKLIREKELLKITYEQAILQAQFEIQDQTLRNVSQEIHDNIGQVLSYVSLSLDRAGRVDGAEKNEIISESRSLVNQSMGDLRDLSKSFSLDNIASNGLAATVNTEVNRLNKSRLISASLIIEGDIYSVGEHEELVLFRIFQEIVNNTLKHARAKNLTVALHYGIDKLTLSINDDGVGFDVEKSRTKDGSGLKNIITRTSLIGAEVETGSAEGVGSWIKISIVKAAEA